MPSDFDEQISLNGSYIGRPESPVLEGSAAYAIEEAFRTLIESRYLYQKTPIDLGRMEASVAEAVRAASLRAAAPSAAAGRGSPDGLPPPTPISPQRLAMFRDEIGSRPWRAHARHFDGGPEAAAMHRLARSGTQPLGIAQNEMNLSFYLPAVQMPCPKCKRGTTFTALVHSSGSAFDSPYSREGASLREQIFLPIYRCEICRRQIYAMLVRRTGLRLHLCGFAPRREPLANHRVPDLLMPILTDAEQAVSEGDVFAGFYHLRTMLEHYLRDRLGIAPELVARGDELVSAHNQGLAPEIKSLLPSLGVAYENLSRWLHTRTGEVEDYTAQREAICKHIAAVGLLTGTVPR